MKIELAKSAGFCFGVKRAVDTVYKTLGTGEKVYTFGPIVHNEQVISELEMLGTGIVTEEDLDSNDISDCTVIIRAHGIPEAVEEKIKSLSGKNVKFVDATCVFVKKIHDIVRKESDAGKFIVVIGDPAHPEVQGIIGRISEKAAGTAVLLTESDVEGFETKAEKIAVVAQTTFNHNKFQQFLEILNKKSYNTIVYDTICNATEERQREAAVLARRNDAVIVIGSRQSSNTRKLYEISKQECANTYLIEQPGDLRSISFGSFCSVGITAGASTPNNIIKEVLSIMSEENFEQLLEESLKSIHNGEVVEGTVIRVKEDEIALNIGYKSDGIIARSEYTNDSNADLRTLVKEGDKLQVKVIKVNDGDGQVMLSYKRLAAERGYKRIEEAMNNKEVLTGPVTEVTKGGLSVDVEGVRVFIPTSLVADIYDQNLEKYKDQAIEFRISEYNPHKRRIIGDRKSLIVEKKKELQEELLGKINEGDIITGVIKNVTKFGVFIDMGGVDGLVHVSELSWTRIANPEKAFKEGEEVRAFIKKIDRETGKIALSMKFPDQNPWADIDEKFAPGTIVKGKVARLTKFGAFVELAPGVDALLHVSQISKERIEEPSQVLKVGQEIEAVVTDVNADEKKISLSIKKLLADSEPEEVAEEAAEGASEE